MATRLSLLRHKCFISDSFLQNEYAGELGINEMFEL